MTFPDQSHINRVRDALWQRSAGGASLMVGAGFSRNAEKSRPDAHDPPTWRDLAGAMHDKLYPQSDDGPEPGSFTRLAQEYETAFGRDDLHRFIRQLVRDDDFKPGDMHSRLMRLPWRDVFTTNWDTLLERTRPSVIARKYSIVCNMDEIPLASRPRIVKLHGSVPAHFPLIFTEEDYRTYPIKFAPFVNTAQQAMMETVLCLIGFSGDDPNFLHWSGWVRDNLGSSAPKIYLAGWLDLLPHRRRMLEDRNVVPIDLSRHPKSHQWPEHLRPRYATDWLLHTLEYGRPHDVSNWPSPSKRQSSQYSKLLEPIERVALDEPRDEPQAPSSEDESTNLLESVQEILGAWKHNRELYPGWLIIPGDRQSLLSWDTQQWEPLILRLLPDLGPMDRLSAIRELIWRREILLEPISQDLEAAAQGILNEIDCQNHAIGGSVDMNPDWTSVREAWLFIALALVTAARQRFDRDVFVERLDSLSFFQDDNRDVAHRIHHERCLWAINSLEYEALENLLEDWRLEKNCDPVWMMRKSALLHEMGCDEVADKLIEDALTAIRENPADDRSVSGPSRESWALFSTLEFENLDHETGPWRRWEELTPLKCNAPVEKRHYFEAIRGIEKNPKGPPFDFGMVSGYSITISGDEHYRRIAARRAVRLTEIAGLSPTRSGMVIASDILDLAADKLFQHEPELAIRLVLRITESDRDDRLNNILSRTHIASISSIFTENFAKIIIDAIEFSLSKTTDSSTDMRSMFWTGRLRVFIEVLSRFVVRLDPEMVESIFGKALQWYGNERIARDPWAENPVQNILKRSWESLPEQQQRAHVLDILGAPMVGMADFSSSSDRYPDPGYLLTNDLAPPDRATDEKRWQDTVGFLVSGLRVGGEARTRASVRISWMNSRNMLTEVERLLIAHALWGDDHTAHDNLPDGTALFDWAFLVSPEPTPGIAEHRFRRKWLNTEIPSGEDLSQEDLSHIDDVLLNIGSAIFNLAIRNKPLILSDQERDHLATLVARWAGTDIPYPLHVSGMRELMFRKKKESTRQAILGLRPVILEVHLSESVAEKLYQKFKKLNESDTPALSLAAGLIKSLPARFDDVVLSMRMALASDDHRLATNAARGLQFWLSDARDSAAELRPPPIDLVREIGVIIATRRKAVLGQALEIAKWVFSDGDSEHRNAIGELASQGLGYLAQELRYDGSHDPDVDVPFLRWGCTHLALAMAPNGFNADPAVTKWVESARSDPLPEVRHAKGPAGEHSSDAVSDTHSVSDRPE